MGRLEDLEQIHADEQDDPLTCFLLGGEYLNAKRYEDAARVLKSCVAAKRIYTAAWRKLGDALRLSEQSEAAKTAYREGIAVAEETRDLQVKKECEAMLRKMEREG